MAKTFRTFSLLLGVVVAAIGTTWASPPVALIKVGVVKGLLRDIDPRLFPVVATAFSTVMESQTGLAGQLLMMDSAEDAGQRISKGELQLGVLSGVEYGWMMKKQPELRSLMVCAIDSGALQAVLVVAKDSRAKTIQDCKGETLTIPHGLRSDTRLFLSHRCRENGASLQQMFPKTIRASSVEEALDSVVDGVTQLVLVERSGLRMFERRKPARFNRLAVLEQSASFPPSVIVFRQGALDNNTLDKFRDGMSTAHKTPVGVHLMTLMNIKQFEPITADYQKSVDAILKTYPAPATDTIPPQL